MSHIKPGRRYRHRQTGAVLFVVRIDKGRVPAWPDPADLEFRVEEGRNPGHTGVTTLANAEADFEEVE